MNYTPKPILFIGLSFFLHYILLQQGYFSFRNNKKTPDLLQRSVKITQLSPTEIRKYRRVGVKGGKKKDYFTMPLPQNKTKPSTTLDGLALKNVKASNKKPERSKTFNKRNSINFKNYRYQSKSIVQQKNVQKKILKELAPGSEIQEVVGATGLNLKFEPVEGVSEDELNSAEKIYYSFEKRSLEKYYLSFIKAFNQLSLSRPFLRKNLLSKEHLLTGRVLYDKEGNILSIKILKSSPDDHIHALFEETLKQIQKMPNPPKDFLKNEQFSIFYKLHIKR